MKFIIFLSAMVLCANAFAFNPEKTRFTCRASCVYFEPSSATLMDFGPVKAGSNFSRSEAFTVLQNNCARKAGIEAESFDSMYLVKRGPLYVWLSKTKSCYRLRCGYWSCSSVNETEFYQSIEEVSEEGACTENESIPFGPPQYIGSGEAMG